MSKNLALKTAIWESGLSQIEVAKAAAMHEARLSHIINGHRSANEREQKALARVLKRTAARLGFKGRRRRATANPGEEQVAS